MDRSLFYVSTTMLWGMPPEEWFRIAAEEELGGVEVWAQQLESQGISPEEVLKLSIQYGKTVTVHNYSWDLNLISLSRPMRDAAIALTKKGIDLASYLHASQVTTHPGREGLAIPGADFDKLLAESFVVLSRYAEEEGTRISFEIMEKIPKERFTSAEEALRVESLAEGPLRWGYTEDIAHCDSEEEIFSIASRLKGRIVEFHLSNKKGTTRHVGDVEHGDFPLPAIAEKLASYGIPFALEGFDPSMKAERLYRTLHWLDGDDVSQGIGAQSAERRG